MDNSSNTISEDQFESMLHIGANQGEEECTPLSQFSSFSGTAARVDNALIGWEGQDFTYGYIEGFYSLVHSSLELQLALPDLLVYPTIYNYRHYIEIALKEILFSLQLYFSEPIDNSFRHDLEGCLIQVRGLLEKYNISFFIPEEIAQLILEMQQLDNNNTYFRYAFQDTGELSQNYDYTYIDLRELHFMMNTVHDYFSAILISLSDDGIMYNQTLDFYFKAFISKILKIKSKKITQINNLIRGINFKHPEHNFRYCVEIDTRQEHENEYSYRISDGSYLYIGYIGNTIKSISVSLTHKYS